MSRSRQFSLESAIPSSGKSQLAYYSRTSIIRTSIIRISRLSGFLDYPDFFSGPNLVINIY